jgi:pSer/pThr/pTyr-binding forkhead associated (FHA) protein
MPGQSPAAYSEHAAPAPGPIAPGAKVLRGFLVSFQSNPQGDFWALYTGRSTVGRANAGEPADVPLADATISSRHAALVVDPDRVIVEDTNSTNGTYVNEEPIGQNGKRELRDGDRLRFGGFTTLVKILGRL